MSPLKHDPWRQLASGLYVPPLLHRYPGYPCCCCPRECDHCEGGGCPPSQLEVTVSGIVEFTGCGVCDATFNSGGSPFIFDWTASGSRCVWRYDISTTCDVQDLTVEIRDLAGLYYVYLEYQPQPQGVFRTASLGSSSPLCSIFDTSVALPFFSHSGSFCDYRSASASVVAA